MKKKNLLIFIIASLLLVGCHKEEPEETNRIYGDENNYALFMYNYPRVVETSPNGNSERMENALYLKKQIELNTPFEAPENPTRKNYEFEGWYKEKGCTNEWNFTTDFATTGSVYLYAKWGISQSEDYVEPEYVYPEKIITDANYRVTGILNKQVGNITIKIDDVDTVVTGVELTTGAIKRLENHAENVSFAVNYERKANVMLNVATYDIEAKKIHLEASSGETFDYYVKDITASLGVPSTYESKAVNYANTSGDYDNYHIMMAGSSSMEFWTNYSEAMSPIVTYNHGIGGTTIEQWTNQLTERLVLPYSPKAVVYYVGVNNIINSNDTGAVAGNKLNALFDKTHEFLPNTKIFYVLINKLPGYARCQEDFDVANEMAIEYANSHDYLTCIDAGAGLLKESGQPHAAYFRTDGLHMSKYGYIIWGEAIKEAIINWLG